MKKSLKGISVLVLIFLLVVNCFCVNAQAFSVEQQGSSLIIQGTGTPQDSVSVILVKKSDDTITDKLFVVDETIVKSDGTYTITVKIPEEKENISSTGDFELMVRAGTYNMQTYPIIGYISETSRISCVYSFTQKAQSELPEFFKEETTKAVMKVLGVQLPIYESLENKSDVFLILDNACDRTSFSEEDIRPNLNKAIGIVALGDEKNDFTDNALSTINSSFENIKYKDISNSELKSYLNTSFDEKKIESFDEYDKLYLQYNIFYILNNSNPASLLTSLEGYGDELEIDDNDEYKKFLNKNNKDEICDELVEAITAKPISSIADLVSKLSDAMKKASDDENDNIIETGKGSGSFGGGGGGGISRPSGPSITTNVVETPKENLETSQTPFNDMAGYEWAEKAVLELNKKGIISGDGTGKYNPERNVTREEFSKILMLAMGIDKDNAECNFEDVPKDSWYYQYVAALNQADIINGIGNGQFGTGMYLTREDMSVMIYKALLKTNSVSQKVRAEKIFDDASQISDYAKEAVKTLYVTGTVNGTGECFEPKRFCTRAEAAKLIYEAFVKEG